jgi:uncharacterized membrane protein
MNLNLTMLGWVHSLACVLALALGGVLLVRPKGTQAHKALGQIYMPVMIVVCLTSLFIFEATGDWFFPHTLAVVTLGALAAGWLAAHFRQPRRLWINIHLSAMIVSYYMLIGGGINEAFLRVDALRALLGPEMIASPVLGVTHQVVMLVFLVWLVRANVATMRGGRKRRLAVGRA